MANTPASATGAAQQRERTAAPGPQPALPGRHPAQGRAQGQATPPLTDSRQLWAKIPPAEHYRRLLALDNDEAWQHLGDLIWLRVKHSPYMATIQRRGGSVEDQVHDLLLHVLRKIRRNALNLDDPRCFYGLLKVMVDNYLINQVRKKMVEDAAVSWDQLLTENRLTPGGKADCDQPLAILMQQTIWRIITEEVKFSKVPEHRMAVVLALQMKMGLNGLRDNQELADHLAQYLGREVTYNELGGWLHSGMQKVRQHLVNAGITSPES